MYPTLESVRDELLNLPKRNLFFDCNFLNDGNRTISIRFPVTAKFPIDRTLVWSEDEEILLRRIRLLYDESCIPYTEQFGVSIC